jgi:uncharacterized protein
VKALVLAVLSLSLLAGAGCSGAQKPVQTGIRLWPEALDRPSTPATHRQAVADLLAATNMDRTMKASMDALLKAMLQQQPQLRPFEDPLREFLARHLSVSSLMEPLCKVYMARFTELELRQMVAFYRTDLGRKMAAELPVLTQEGARIGQEAVQRHLPELQQQIMERMRGQPGQPVPTQ